jgi:hypothetical protein
MIRAPKGRRSKKICLIIGKYDIDLGDLKYDQKGTVSRQTAP